MSDNEQYDAHWAAGYATLLCRLNMTPVSEKNTNLRLDEPITRAEVAQLVNFYLLRAPAATTKGTTTKLDLSEKKVFRLLILSSQESISPFKPPKASDVTPISISLPISKAVDSSFLCPS